MSIHQSTDRFRQWSRLLTACGPLLPSAISFLFPSLTIPLFTPRQIINDDSLWSFLFGIWAVPASFSGQISRVIQATIIFLLPATTFQYYCFWLFAAAFRTGVGQLLTRVVGWAAPRFFNHWALYETCGGYGPSIAIHTFLFGGPDVVRPLFKPLHKVNDLSLLVCTSALLCWLDNAPWTYGEVVLGASGISLALWIFQSSSSLVQHGPILPDNQKHTSPKLILGSTILALIVISFPYGMQSQVGTFVPTTMPPSHSTTSSLLEILILSYPRPNVEASTSIMTTTINSFIPYLDSNVTLSVFTHSASHAAFNDVRMAFASSNVTFYMDADIHSDYWSGQYLHIAEAFLWVLDGTRHAEWVMLVEDDFPICGGDRGWDALKRVFKILEAQSAGEGVINRQGGFVGTGGSGLIIHRTLLPILVFLMRAHAEIASKLPPTSVRRPADVVMQDCLLGTDPLCTQKGGKLIITSRLIMDHIGGMVTTNINKPLNSDKWRCGWRHPFHGSSMVDVVVV